MTSFHAESLRTGDSFQTGEARFGVIDRRSSRQVERKRPPVISAPAPSRDDRAFMNQRPPPKAGPRPFEMPTSGGLPSTTGRRAAGFTPRAWFIGRHDRGGGADGGRTIPRCPVGARRARYLPRLGG